MNLLDLLDHSHPENVVRKPEHLFHYITIGSHRFCARCLGMYSAGIVSFIVFAYLYSLGVSFHFNFVFTMCWLLAGFCIVDWLLSKTSLWGGNNLVRVLTGSSLGVAYTLYFWFLPLDWPTRLLSLGFIHLSMKLVILMVTLRQEKKSLSTLLDDMWNHTSSRTYCCSCACPCCMGDMLWYGIGCLVCAGVLCFACSAGMGGCCKR